MAIRAVFFDLDDTLLDVAGSHPERAKRIATLLATELPAFDANSFISRALSLNPATGWVTGVASLINELGLRDSEVGAMALGMWFFQGCYDLARCFPGAASTIRSLASSYSLGVITNGLEARQRPKFEALGLAEHFQVFVTSERAKAEKPAAEIFRLALEEASLEPPEAVFVGDRLDVDILGARQAGLHAIWFDLQRPSLGSCDIEPNATIRSFEELPAAIASLNAA